MPANSRWDLIRGLKGELTMFRMFYYIFSDILIFNNDKISALRSQRVVIRCKATSCNAQRN